MVTIGWYLIAELPGTGDKFLLVLLSMSGEPGMAKP